MMGVEFQTHDESILTGEVGQLWLLLSISTEIHWMES